MNIALNSGWNRIMDCYVNEKQRFMVSACDDFTLKVFSTQDFVEIKTLNGHIGPVRSVCGSEDGKIIFSCSSDRSIISWDLSNFSKISQKKDVHSTRVFSISCNTKGDIVVTSSEDGSIKIWSFKNREFILLGEKSHAHLGRISSSVISSDGCLLVTSGEDGLVKLWDLLGSSNSIQELQILDDHKGRALGCDLSKSSNLLATTSSDSSFKVYQRSNTNSSSSFELIINDNVAGKEIRCCSISESEEFLLFGCEGGGLIRYNLQTREKAVTIDNTGDTIRWCYYSEYLENMISASEDSVIKVFDLKNDLLTNVFGHSNPIQSICYLSKLNVLAYSLGDFILRFYSLKTNLDIPEYNFKSRVTSIIEHGDSCVISLENGGVYLINTKVPKPKLLFSQGVTITSMLSLDEIFVLVGLTNGKAIILDIEKENADLPHFQFHQRAITSMSLIHKKTKYVISASDTGELKFWKCSSDFDFECVKSICIQDAIWDISISKEGRFLALSTKAGNPIIIDLISIENIKEKDLIYLPKQDKDISSCRFNQDSTKLLITSFDRTFSVINIQEKKVLASNITEGHLHSSLWLENGDIYIVGNYGLYGFNFNDI